jgi:hypothetical protein
MLFDQESIGTVVEEAPVAFPVAPSALLYPVTADDRITPSLV